jgi:hypothetical protein
MVTAARSTAWLSTELWWHTTAREALYDACKARMIDEIRVGAARAPALKNRSHNNQSNAEGRE